MNPISSAYNPQIFSQFSVPKQDAELLEMGKTMAEPFQKSLESGIAGLQSTLGVGSSIRANGSSFIDSIGGFVKEVDAKSKEAELARSSILSGESNNIHQAMIASQEAGVSFSLMVEMRNKVLETYQELMRLQV